MPPPRNDTVYRAPFTTHPHRHASEHPLSLLGPRLPLLYFCCLSRASRNNGCGNGWHVYVSSSCSSGCLAYSLRVVVMLFFFFIGCTFFCFPKKKTGLFVVLVHIWSLKLLFFGCGALHHEERRCRSFPASWRGAKVGAFLLCTNDDGPAEP